MNIGIYGILVIFALFIILLIVNPNLSCFGRRVKSPFYPLFRKRDRKKRLKTEDYGFDLGEKGERRGREKKYRTEQKTPAEDYGFDLRGGRPGQNANARPKSKKEIKTEDYGFDLNKISQKKE